MKYYTIRQCKRVLRWTANELGHQSFSIKSKDMNELRIEQIMNECNKITIN